MFRAFEWFTECCGYYIFLELVLFCRTPLLLQIGYKMRKLFCWEQGWRSGESTCLPPMWPGFDSQSRRQVWVEFVVGSRPCSEGFSPGTPVFLPPQKPTFPNSNSTWNARTPLNELRELSGASWVNKLHSCGCVFVYK